MRFPALSASRITISSSNRSGGMRMRTGCPTASSSVYPKMRRAPAFQLVIVPSKVLEMIASSDDSTIAASRSRASSMSLRWVTSRIALVTRTPPIVSTGLRLTSAGNSHPPLRKPNSSSFAPMGRTRGSAKKFIRCPRCRSRKRSGRSTSTSAPNHLFSLIPKYLFGLSVDENDLARFIHYNHRVWCELQ